MNERAKVIKSLTSIKLFFSTLQVQFSGYTHNPYNGVVCNDIIMATGVFSSKELWRLSKCTIIFFFADTPILIAIMKYLQLPFFKKCLNHSQLLTALKLNIPLTIAIATLIKLQS